jgi:hypothetical protein
LCASTWHRRSQPRVCCSCEVVCCCCCESVCCSGECRRSRNSPPEVLCGHVIRLPPTSVARSPCSSRYHGKCARRCVGFGAVRPAWAGVSALRVLFSPVGAGLELLGSGPVTRRVPVGASARRGASGAGWCPAHGVGRAVSCRPVRCAGHHTRGSSRSGDRDDLRRGCCVEVVRSHSGETPLWPLVCTSMIFSVARRGPDLASH